MTDLLPASRVIHGRKLMLDERIGQGGAAVVWRGRIELNGAWKQVAIKHYSGHGANQRARHEAEVMRLLEGRSVPQLHDVDPEQGLLVMQLCDGIGLDRLLEECGRHGTGLPVRAVVGIGLRVAEALEETHNTTGPEGRPLVHLDLKPANILLERNGVRLLDFGIATLDQERADGSGTPGYMAPEQRRRETVGPPTDIYALGLLLRDLAIEPARARSTPVSSAHAKLEVLIRRFTAADPRDRPPQGTHARAELRTLFEELGGGVDDLRLVYSLVRQRHDTRAAPPPSGDDWARFFEAFSPRTPGPTRFKPLPGPAPAPTPSPTPSPTRSASPAPVAGPEARIPTGPPANPTFLPPAPARAPSPPSRRARTWFVLIAMGALLATGALFAQAPPDSLFGVRLVSHDRRALPTPGIRPPPAPAPSGSDEPAGGTARVRSDYPFELWMEGTPIGPPAKTHTVPLAPGTHTLLARCTGCPPGLTQQVETTVRVNSGVESRVKVRFR